MEEVQAETDGAYRTYMEDFPESLKKVVQNNDYGFLTKTAASEDEDECFKCLGNSSGNIFHFAANENNVDFLKEATKILPGHVVQWLCCQQQDEYLKWNPLHVAASKGHRKIVKVILDYYRSQPDDDHIQKPWLGVDEGKETPLHTALYCRFEGVAMDILSMDVELLSNIQNDRGYTPTYLAVGFQLNRLAVKILTSAPKCSLTTVNGNTVLFNAAESSDKVFKLLVDKAPELIIGRDDKLGDTVLHSWVIAGNLYPFEYVLNKNDIITPALRRGFIHQLCQIEYETGFNPLHYILLKVHDDTFSVKIAEILVNAYKQEMGQLEFDREAPWLMEDLDGHTPLEKAIMSQSEKLALYLFSLDSVKFLQRSIERCAAKVDNNYDNVVVAAAADDDSEENGDDENNDDDNDDSDDSDDDDDPDKKDVNLLLLAIKQKCPKVAEEMLRIIQQNEENYTELLKLITFEDGGSVLNFAPLCTATFLEQLLVTYPQFIKQCNDNGHTVLHHWIDMGGVSAIDYILKTKNINPQSKSSFIALLSHSNADGKQPLHLAAANTKFKKEMVGIVKSFVDASFSKSKFSKLLSTTDYDEKTPLEIAISNRCEDLALNFLSMDEKMKNVGEDIMFKAIRHQCHNVVEYLLDWSIKNEDPKFLKSSDGPNVLHVAWKTTEENGRLIVDKWPELINEDDDSEKKPLERASEAGKAWLVEAILQKDHSSIIKTPRAWVLACEKGHLSTVLAFLDNNYFRSICRQQKDTPLHHIQKLEYKEYQQLLKHKFINELINTQNGVDETPLHIAINSGNRELAELLLTTDGLDWSLKDKNKKSAKALLNEKSAKESEWDDMCKLIGVDQMLKAKYIEARTNLIEMRGTISVVATLLATITITAGFAVPGGVDSNGDAVLSGSITFWVFVISNAYAMCCAILILFCNTWSMVSVKDMALRLIDRSLWLLKQSLYGTLVAFTLAMFTVIHKRSFWAAIVVAVMVFLMVVLAQREVLYKVLDLFKYIEDCRKPGLDSSTERIPLVSESDDIENQATAENKTTISFLS